MISADAAHLGWSAAPERRSPAMIRAALIFLFGVLASCPCLVIHMPSPASHAAPQEVQHRAAKSLSHRTIAQDACWRIGPAPSGSGQPDQAVAEDGGWVQYLREIALLPVADLSPFVAPDTARALLQVYRL